MTFKTWVDSIIGIGNTIVIPIIFALAFLAFVWGMLNYFILHPDDEGKREEGKSFILWGILGMALLFSVWGVVNLLLDTLGLAPA